MPRRKKKKEAGVPEWVVTYGDMMSLLLTFFILIVSFSEIIDEDQYDEAIKAVQQAFGVVGGGGIAPMEDIPMNTVIENLTETHLFKEPVPKLSQSEDPGVVGKQIRVKRIREGLLFSLGGRISFEPGSAELKPQGKRELKRIADLTRGQTNKIEVRGHATPGELNTDSEFDNLWDLSYARARAALRHLQSLEIDPRRVRLIGCADKEPLVAGAYTADERAVNRRIEVIVTEALMQQFDATAEKTTPLNRTP
jgi:chemotaxis protein MotB